jgi:valyl-tRNA synthetase
VQISEQNHPGAEAEFDLIVECIKAARSIVGMYNLPTNGKTIEDKITGTYSYNFSSSPS